MSSARNPHRIVIIGGGVAGLDLATHLSRQPTARGRLQVALVDREPAHVWKPMLHEIAAGTRDVHEQQIAYAAQARRHRFSFHLGEVAALDRAEKRVQLGAWNAPGHGEVLPARSLDYDTLILAFGSRANDFGTHGVAEHCRMIDSRADAIAFYDDVRVAILKALSHGGSVKIGIVGGGATGVQLAAELVALADLSQSFGAEGMAGRLQVTLLEMSARLLAGFPERVAEAARHRLQSLNVVVRTGARVAAAEPQGFRLADGSLIEAGLMVWAAGVQSSRFPVSPQPLEGNQNGQIKVTGQLRTVSDAAVFALGDCASLQPKGGARPLPPTAQVASQQARYLCARLPEILAGREVPDFAYRDFGSLVSLGGFGAYGSLGRLGFFEGGFIQGRVAQIGHALLYRRHQVRLHGFWRGSLLWLADALNTRLEPPIQLD